MRRNVVIIVLALIYLGLANLAVTIEKSLSRQEWTTTYFNARHPQVAIDWAVVAIAISLVTGLVALLRFLFSQKNNSFRILKSKRPREGPLPYPRYAE